jgi:hypothetical protein
MLAIDQWKCDKLGCCMPWVKPSNSCQPPCATGTPQAMPAYMPYAAPQVGPGVTP